MLLESSGTLTIEKFIDAYKKTRLPYKITNYGNLTCIEDIDDKIVVYFEIKNNSVIFKYRTPETTSLLNSEVKFDNNIFKKLDTICKLLLEIQRIYDKVDDDFKKYKRS